MKVLGYGVAVPVEGHEFWRMETGLACTKVGAECTAAAIPGGVALVAVPVADLDVEQAVERAARWHFDRGIHIGAGPDPQWEKAPVVDQDRYRNEVRPIVLAALGIES